MFIVMIAPECGPVVKVGGLADVVEGLTRELERRGNTVEVILPKYDCLRYDHIRDFQVAFKDLRVPWYGGAIHCDVWSGFVSGTLCFFIDAHSSDLFFNRGLVYGHDDDVMRFAFFCKAALEFMIQTGKHPEIIHCHDWPTALVPVLLYEMYQHRGMTGSRVCLTVHNFKHQGPAGEALLAATNLNRPEYYFSYDQLRDNHNPFSLNLLKGGIVYSNFVTTVSPKHAWEARFTDQGFGLQHTLYLHQNKFGGVLNGIDYDLWNPETDPTIPCRYGIDTIGNKAANKAALRRRFSLQDTNRPVIAFIGRLDPQKGLALVEHALFYALGGNTQFVLLGSGSSAEINDYWLHLKQRLEGNLDSSLEIGFDETLARLIYAGADIIIMPSMFEPCGLTQMIAMRYGTVPIVRSVGGLADTVFDLDDSGKPMEERNGFVFLRPDNSGIESALRRAVTLWHDEPERFLALMKNGMGHDLSWNHPGEDYLNIYNHILAEQELP